MKIFGLTGGIASGKSTVSKILQAAGIPVYDMDKIGRDLIEKNSEVQQGLLKICGVTDRTKIRGIIFSNPEKRKEVESFLHPLILKEFDRQAKLEKTKGTKLIISEAALLIEVGRYKELDGLIVVLSDEATRKDRLIKRDGITEALAKQMLQAQVDDRKRREAATVVLENNGSLAELEKKARDLSKTLLED